MEYIGSKADICNVEKSKTYNLFTPTPNLSNVSKWLDSMDYDLNPATHQDLIENLESKTIYYVKKSEVYKMDYKWMSWLNIKNVVFLKNDNKNLYYLIKQNKIFKSRKSTHSNIHTKLTLKNICDEKTLSLYYNKYIAIYRILYILLFGYMCSMIFYTANANTIADNKAKTSPTQQSKTAQPQKVQVKGDTLVIQNASCLPNNKTLLQSLKKDSKNTTTPQECDDSNHK